MARKSLSGFLLVLALAAGVAQAQTKPAAPVTPAAPVVRDALSSLPGDVSGVLDVSTAPRLVLQENDHGVANTRILAVGDEYLDGWTFAGASDRAVTMRKNGQDRQVPLRIASAPNAETPAATLTFGGAAGAGRGGFGGRGGFAGRGGQGGPGGAGRGGAGRGGGGGLSLSNSTEGGPRTLAINPAQIQDGAAAFTAAMASGDFTQLNALAAQSGVDPAMLQGLIQGMNGQGGATAVRIDPQTLGALMGAGAGAGGGGAVFIGRGGRGGPPAQ